MISEKPKRNSGLPAWLTPLNGISGGLLFLSMINLSLLVILLSYGIISNFLTTEILITRFALNLPFCILLGVIDLWTINVINRRKAGGSNAARIAVDLTMTTMLSIVSTALINYIIMYGNKTIDEVLINSITIVPINLIIVSQIEIYIYHRQQADTEKRLGEMEKERALYQLEALKNRISPHFLFNSLNILASLAYQDADKTNMFAKKLSSVYRYLLMTQGRPTVTLEEEMQFVHSYIYLETIRFGDTLAIETCDYTPYLQRTVIPASIQMLVENALKHNINTTKSPLRITIHAGADGITVANNLQMRKNVGTSGTGLDNLRRQYTLYGKEISVTKNGREFSVKMPLVD